MLMGLEEEEERLREGKRWNARGTRKGRKGKVK